ncbi:MAG: hypothetical protein OXI88_02670 [Gammaproteobacteria bacterium]|nr:hypothetical protein [Gammaproteobacteria bacterium]MDE0282986.1 hypothetical protein [Gammaproteobacteria bacterium]MDE0510675.1 hypothetical protein [Gammaproteobacteria bacterium]
MTDTSITTGAAGPPAQAQGPDDTSATTGPGRAAEHGAGTGADSAVAGSGADEFRVGAESLISDQRVGLLFVKRSMVFSTLANDRIKITQDKLRDYKEMNRMIEKMRNSQLHAGGHGAATKMDADVVAFCKKYDIKLDTTDHDTYHTKSEWDYNIESANGTREKWSDELRVLMLKLKAVMSELDTSVSGASSLEDKSAHLAKKVVS